MRCRARWPVRGSRRPAFPALIELDGPQLSSILEANHKVMVRQNMLEKGTTQEQAEAQIGLIALRAQVSWPGEVEPDLRRQPAGGHAGTQTESLGRAGE